MRGCHLCTVYLKFGTPDRMPGGVQADGRLWLRLLMSIDQAQLDCVMRRGKKSFGMKLVSTMPSPDVTCISLVLGKLYCVGFSCVQGTHAL